MKAFYNRNIGMDIMGWSILGITLFLIIPMLYPANLPLVYHIYHLVLFIVLIGIYYLNIRLVIPKTVHRSINFYYIILFFVMGALTVSLMSFVATYLNLQEEVYNRLYPENEFIVSEHKSYVNYYVFLLTAIVLMIGFANYFITKWNIEERKKLALQELKSKAELGNLKAQINPHFFFNTLNTIYALTHKDIEKSQNAILKLSKMMRYAMNEENLELVSLQYELVTVHNYLDLMSHRLSSNVTLEFHISEHTSEAKIAPMILLTFIENCFKHGISSEEECLIKISAFVKRNTFILKTVNPWFENRKESKGIGVENTIKRLDILYNEGYNLKQTIIDGKYFTTLKISLK